VNIVSGQCKLGADINLRVVSPRFISSLASVYLNSLFKMFFKYVIAAFEPTIVASG
jgi:hypothetical protein